MDFKKSKPEKIEGNPVDLIGNGWMLICAGDKGKYNMMTASWGGMGELWSEPVCFIFIRPSRHTYEFIENNQNFSINFFSNSGKVERKYRKILNWCGSHSGRDKNKMEEVNLTPIEENGTIYFEEATQVVLCKKIYFQDLQPDQFLDDFIEKNYNGKDYHRMYVGKIEKVLQKKS